MSNIISRGWMFNSKVTFVYGFKFVYSSWDCAKVLRASVEQFLPPSVCASMNILAPILLLLPHMKCSILLISRQIFYFLRKFCHLKELPCSASAVKTNRQSWSHVAWTLFYNPDNWDFTWPVSFVEGVLMQRRNHPWLQHIQSKYHVSWLAKIRELLFPILQ